MPDPSQPAQKRGPLALLQRYGSLALSVLVALFFVVILGMQDRFPSADGPFILFVGSDIGHSLVSLRPFQALRDFVMIATPHPPLGYTPLVLLLPLLPLRGAIVLASGLAIGLIVDGLIRLGRPAPPWASVCVGLLGLGSALTWWAADHYGFDLVATAAVIQALSWLHASKLLSRKRAAWAFGLWLGVAFMVKYTAPLTLFLPVVIYGAIALVKNPKGLLRAVGGWAVVALPFYLYNGARVLDYAGLTVAPPDTPGEFSQGVTMEQRFSGEEQLSALTALEDAMGLPGLLFAAAVALLLLRPLPLLAAVSGFALMSSLNVCEGRYLLPMTFLLAIAALPRALNQGKIWLRVLKWAAVVVATGLGVASMYGSISAYAHLDAETTPTHRGMIHDADSLLKLDSWPYPAEPFMPVSGKPRQWQVSEVNQAVADLIDEAEQVLISGQCTGFPGLAPYALLGINEGSYFGWVELHLAHGPENDFLASSTLLPGSTARFAYIVHGRREASVEADWLEARAHRSIQTFDLPHECVGHLIELEQPFAAEEGVYLWSYQPGEARGGGPGGPGGPGAPPPPPNPSGGPR